MAAAKIVAERSRVDVVEARIAVLTAQVASLEDFQVRVECLTQGIPARGFMGDFEEAWLEMVMARERDYQSTLRWVASAVATAAPVVAPGAVVGPGAPLEGEPS